MIRLGVPARLLGAGAPPGGPFGGQAQADLSRWLATLFDIVRYLGQRGIGYYRLALPAGPTGSALDQQLAECRGQLALLEELIAGMQLRLSIHAEHHVVLNSGDAGIRARSVAQLKRYSLLLDSLVKPQEGTIVVHSSAEGGTRAALARFSQVYSGLPVGLQQRLAVEHGESGCSLGDLLALHQACGVAVVLDYLHLQLHNPERLRLPEALGLALATWPARSAAEVHLSSPRTEGHLLPGRRGNPPAVIAPRPGQHADYVAPGDLLALLAASTGLGSFDIMIEAKAGDLALLRLRDDLRRLAPAWADKVG